MKRTAALMVALLMTVALTVPAMAAMPVPYEDDSQFLNCAELLGLGPSDPGYAAYDFDIWNHTVGQEQYSETLDDSGALVGSRVHLSGKDNLYNVEKPERVAKGPFGFSIVGTLLDPDKDIWQFEMKGTFWNVHVPGEGWVWKWSGHTTMLYEGPAWEPFFYEHRGVEDYEFQALCDYLK